MQARNVTETDDNLQWLCHAAGIDPAVVPGPGDSKTAGLDLDRVSLATKLKRRRRAAGLSQADLARRAGIRPETLSRIECGRTTPDFATVRKLVVAMNAAEQEQFTCGDPAMV